MATRPRRDIPPFARRALPALGVLTVAAWLLAAGCLAMEFGYYAPPLPAGFLHACQLAAAVVFLADWPIRYLLAPSRRDRVARTRGELLIGILLPVTVATVAVLQIVRGRAEAIWPGALAAVQLFLVGQLLLRSLRLWSAVFGREPHPARMLVTSFLVLIVAGTLALKLPRAVAPGSEDLYWHDALFTATSAVCVTGLVVRATGSDQDAGTPAHLQNGNLQAAGFSRFGQVVILALIQLGGLGIMIIGTLLAVLMGRRMSLRHTAAMSDVVSSGGLGDVGRVVRFIVLMTFAFEAVGAAMLWSMWSDFDWPARDKLLYSVFHSVSAFCNAGFSLTPDSLVRYHRYWQVHAVIAPLIVIGGLGFPVLMALRDWIGYRLRALLGRPRSATHRYLPLHSKLVLATSGLLILIGAVGYLALESTLTAGPDAQRVGKRQETESYRQVLAEKQADAGEPHRLADESPGAALADSVFMSISSRTAGFNTVRIDYGDRDSGVGAGTLFMTVLLMLVGGSPGSTAGGMKTVTFAVLLLTVSAVVRRRGEVEGFRRALTDATVRRAATIAVCYLGVVGAVTLALCITEAGHGHDFMELLFESTSACGTVGLSTGLTDKLTVAGRLVVTVAMFVGRLGPLTMLVAMARRSPSTRYQLPAENVVLG